VRPPRQAVILAAGHGRRLRPFTDRRCKPLMTFLNLPLLQHSLRLLARSGVQRVALNAFHLAAQLRAALPSLREPGLELQLVEEPELLGTGGGLANLWRGLSREPTFVLVCDVIADFDLAALACAHQQAGALATMALTAAADPELFGPVQCDEAGLLTDIVGLTGAGGGAPRVNASAHLLEPEFIEALPLRPSCLVRDGYVPALRAGARCLGFEHRGSWAETGTPQALLAAQQAALGGRLAVDAGLLRAAGRLAPDASSLVHPEAELADDAVLDGGTTVAAGARIGAAARLSRCLVLPGAVVAAGSRHADAILDGGA